MPSSSEFSVAVAFGFSLAVLASKSTVLLSDPKKQILHTVLFSSWSVYLITEVVASLIKSESNILFILSSVLYNVAICSILYLSMNRTIALCRTGILQKVTRIAIYPTVVTFFLLRIFHTVVVILGQSGTFIVKPNIIQAATLLPILALRNFYDVVSLREVINFQIITNRLLGGNMDGGDRAVKMMAINLAYEIFLSFFAMGVAAVEATGYSALSVSNIDWLLISWALGNAIDQRQYLRAVFQVRGSNSSSPSDNGKQVV